jgi:release factor glutamine methyltransferase
MTIAEAVVRARDRLLAGGVPAGEAPGDAEVLARAALVWDLTRYAVGRSEPAPPGFVERYETLIARRQAREPVSQIVGHREFWGLDFEVTRDVLTPRPETELVVQAALDVCARLEEFSRHPPVIVDIGTGSGCIAIALATELPAARFIASDASLAALTVARRNAVRHTVERRIAFRHTPAIPPENDVDVVVSNPPYIPRRERESLAPEVRDYEPDLALFGGDDGLDFFRLLFSQVHEALSANGRLIIEVGYDQAAAVLALANPRFWEVERSYRDLHGIARVLSFKALRESDAVDDDVEDEDE